MDSRQAAEAAFKKATTKPLEPVARQPSIPNAKELVSLRTDRDVLEYFQESGPGWQDRINEALKKVAGKLASSNSNCALKHVASTRRSYPSGRLYGPKDGSKKEDTTMADPSGKKRNPAAVKAIPQHEVDARLLREKAARLKELRLAHEATNAYAGSPAVLSGQKKLKRSIGKSADKGQSLSDWLTTQQNQGLRG